MVLALAITAGNHPLLRKVLPFIKPPMIRESLPGVKAEWLKWDEARAAVAKTLLPKGPPPPVVESPEDWPDFPSRRLLWRMINQSDPVAIMERVHGKPTDMRVARASVCTMAARYGQWAMQRDHWNWVRGVAKATKDCCAQPLGSSLTMIFDLPYIFMGSRAKASEELHRWRTELMARILPQVRSRGGVQAEYVTWVRPACDSDARLVVHCWMIGRPAIIKNRVERIRREVEGLLIGFAPMKWALTTGWAPPQLTCLLDLLGDGDPSKLYGWGLIDFLDAEHPRWSRHTSSHTPQAMAPSTFNRRFGAVGVRRRIYTLERMANDLTDSPRRLRYAARAADLAEQYLADSRLSDSGHLFVEAARRVETLRVLPTPGNRVPRIYQSFTNAFKKEMGLPTGYRLRYRLSPRLEIKFGVVVLPKLSAEEKLCLTRVRQSRRAADAAKSGDEDGVGAGDGAKLAEPFQPIGVKTKWRIDAPERNRVQDFWSQQFERLIARDYGLCEDLPWWVHQRETYRRKVDGRMVELRKDNSEMYSAIGDPLPPRQAGLAQQAFAKNARMRRLSFRAVKLSARSA